MSTESERMKILAMIETGQIGVEQGLKLLKALDSAEESSETDSSTAQEITSVPEINPAPVLTETLQVIDPPPVMEATLDELPEPEPSVEPLSPPPRIDPELERWRGFWWIPFWAGVGITVVGASLMFLAWQASGLGFWFACAWFPFLLGVAILAFAWASRTMRWLHIRIQQKSGEWPRNIAISLPIPIRLLAWILRTFGNYIPNVGKSNMDQMLLALEHTSPEAPFYLDVDEDGEHVQVFIG